MSNKPEPKFEKKECPYCKEMVSTYDKIWKGHIANHEKAGDASNTVLMPEKTSEVRYEPKGKELQVLVERAQKAQERFIQAPEAFVDGQLSDHRLSLAAIYVGKDKVFGEPNLRPPTDGSKPWIQKPTEHIYFGERGARSNDVNRGYMPVLNEHGEHVNDQGDWMYTKPYAQYEMEQQAHGKESTHRVQAMTAGMKEMKQDKEIGTFADETITTEKGNINHG